MLYYAIVGYLVQRDLEYTEGVLKGTLSINCESYKIVFVFLNSKSTYHILKISPTEYDIEYTKVSEGDIDLYNYRDVINYFLENFNVRKTS